jgi:SAM-dependent methyltransferase
LDENCKNSSILSTSTVKNTTQQAMKICIFYTPQRSASSSSIADPSSYTSTHTFSLHPIHRQTHRQDIDDTVSKSYEFFFNFLGNDGGEDHGDWVLDAGKYIESLNLPCVGQPSRRSTRAEPSVESGNEYACLIVEFNSTPIPLTPTKLGSTSADITFVDENEDLVLFKTIQRKAVEAFATATLPGCGWCSVSITHRNNTPEILFIIPTPPLFRTHSQLDRTIAHSFPGGYRAFIDILIYTKQHQLRLQPGRSKPDDSTVATAALYDTLAPTYDSVVEKSNMQNIARSIIARYAFTGSILDVGSGNGSFAHLHRETYPDDTEKSSFTGVELSPAMAAQCRKDGKYKKVHVGAMQDILPALLESEKFDHVHTFSALYFIPLLDLALVMACMFMLARRSVTVGVDEIPGWFEGRMRGLGRGFEGVVSVDHVEAVEVFGVPRGWRLVDRWREFGWRSEALEGEVWCSVFRYEKDV